MSIPTKVYDILKNVVDRDIENFTVTLHEGNKKGDGNLGYVFFISLADKRSGKQLNFVVKQAYSDKRIREVHPIRDLYLNEIYFYTELWPKLLQFQEMIPPALRFNNLPKCFTTSSEENSEILVLENLKSQGFVLHDKKTVLRKEQFEFIFKSYGKFHAVSIAFKALHPEQFSELADGIFDIWTTFSKLTLFQNICKFLHQACLSNLKPGIDDAIIEKYKQYVDDCMGIMCKSLVRGEYTTILHGDCWSGNSMYKKNDSGKFVDFRFLDFQVFGLGSPVCDLSYCLYTGGDKKVFDELDHLLQVYHQSLSESLRAYGCDAKELCPLDALKRDWKIYSQLGFILSIVHWRARMGNHDDDVDLTLISEDQLDARKFVEVSYDKEGFEERARDVILHFFENDYFL